MDDFNLSNSLLDWSFDKICDKLLEIATKYIGQHNSKTKRNNTWNNLRAVGIYGFAEIPTLNLDVNRSRLFQSLESRLTFAENWSKTINFTDLKKAKQVFKIFVDLNLYVTVRRVHVGKLNEVTIPITNVINSLDGHVILLGGPGAGKTTISKYLALQLISRQQPWTNKFTFPLVIRFRDLYGDASAPAQLDTFYVYLLRYLGISTSLHFTRKEDIDSQKIYKDYTGITEIFRKMVVEILDQLQTVIVLEGLDEMPDIGSYTPLLSEIQQLVLELNYSKIFLTCRTGIFHTSIQNAETYEIAPLTNDQIELFIKRWIEDQTKSAQLIDQLNSSIYKNTSVRPINIALLCALFERYGEIPPTPKDVYRRIVNLLSEEWDTQRNISRKSVYDRFPIDRKTDFLKQIAFFLTTEFGGLSFTNEQLKYCYKKIHLSFGLPENHMDTVLNEIESHTGLFVQSGYFQYEFSHKSIQEYLTADAIVRIPIETIGNAKLIQLPNELAIATALSYRPNTFFALLIIRELGSLLINYPFTGPYLKRLIDERPDFTDDAILALAIIKLMDFNAVRHASKTFELQEENKVIFTFIASHPNISIAFQNLSNHYFDQSKTSVVLKRDSSNYIDPNNEFKLTKKNGFAELAYSKMENQITVNWPVYKLIYNL